MCIAEEFDKNKGKKEKKALQAANPGAKILSANMYSDSSGSKNLAKVHRAEWEDYLSRFAPIEDMLFEKYNDKEGRAEAVETAGLTMGTAFDNSKKQTDRTMSRYGMNISEPKQNQRDRKFELKKAAGVAGGKNAMRTAKEDQRMGIMTGMSSVKQRED